MNADGSDGVEKLKGCDTLAFRRKLPTVRAFQNEPLFNIAQNSTWIQGSY
jgi:hypothetical protein